MHKIIQIIESHCHVDTAVPFHVEAQKAFATASYAYFQQL